MADVNQRVNVDKDVDKPIIMSDVADVRMTLKIAARRLNLAVEEVDFKINQTITAIQDKYSEGTIVLEVNNGEEINEVFMKNEAYTFRQTYVLSIFKKIKTKNRLNFEFIKNDNLSRIQVVLKAGSIILNDSAFETYLYEELLKICVLNSIIIYHFEGDLLESISVFVSEVKTGILGYDEYFTVASAGGFIEAEDDEIEVFYETHTEQDRNGKVNIYDRRFLKEIREGEVLVEYKKPKFGSIGRNCMGSLIFPKEPVADKKLAFLVDKTSIKIEEQNDRVFYIALKQGVVNVEDEILKIADNMQIQTANVLQTGIITSKDADLKLEVLENNPVMDAVGPSMVINVANIVVNGTIAGRARLTAKDVTILGSTHHTSYVKAEEIARINNHRGFLEANRAEISVLDGGTVKAETVDIKDADGGVITGRDISIQKLGSNCRLKASHTIYVEKIIGESNVIHIDVNATTETNNNISEIKNKLREVIKKINAELGEFKNILKSIKANKMGVDKILANPDRKKNEVHEKIIKQFKASIAKAKILRDKIEELKKTKSGYEIEIETILGHIFDSRIKINSSASKNQTIKFCAPDGKDYYYSFNNKRVPILLKLVRLEDSGFYISAENEQIDRQMSTDDLDFLPNPNDYG